MTTDHLTANQLVLRDLCFATAVANSINTFHWQCIFNEGSDGCEYEFLNDDGTIFSVELLRDYRTDEPTFLVTVLRNQLTDQGDLTRTWVLVNESTLTTDRLVQS